MIAYFCETIRRLCSEASATRKSGERAVLPPGKLAGARGECGRPAATCPGPKGGLASPDGGPGGPYIEEKSKLKYRLESARYNFWNKAKLNMLLKTKGLLKN